jgi:hypothetical protein
MRADPDSTAGREVAMTLTRAERTLANQVSGEGLQACVGWLARRERLSGSPAERAAFRGLAQRARALGLAVEEHAPECYVSWPREAALELLDGAPRPIPCITHAMAASTPPEGLVLDLADVGRAEAPAVAERPLRGRAVLCDGLAMPAKVHRLEAAGAAAQIHVSGERLHEMITSIVWGSPAPDTAALLPGVPVVSITAQGGDTLRAALERGPARVRLRTVVETGWRRLPILVAHLRAPRSGGDFLLLSGHVDSWHAGAMDNASGNAVQLEVARLMAGRRSRLRRDLRLAFWSGHSHARYAGSAWYADRFWRDLHDHCVLHLNADCLGARGATCLSEAISMAETRALASGIVEAVAGQRLSGARPPRAGDQSFWGHGIPSLFMTLSEQPADASETARAYAMLMGGQAKSGGLGWWWHTTEDTPDKLEAAHLVRDAQVYLLVARRFLEDPLLPLDYRAAAAEARGVLEGYAEAAGARFDLGPVTQALRALEAGLRRLARRAAGRLGPRQLTAVNRCLMTLGRELIPINYCRAERFLHDPTLPVPPFPGLEPVRRLGSLDPGSDAARQLQVGLLRQRNKVEHHLRRAVDAVDATLDALRSRAS